MPEGKKDLGDALQFLVGKQLSGAEIVFDYIQLRFGEQYLSAHNFTELVVGDSRIAFTDPSFQDELSKCIGHVIRRVEWIDEECISLIFEDTATLRISLKDADYRGPEAMEFLDETRTLWVT